MRIVSWNCCLKLAGVFFSQLIRQMATLCFMQTPQIRLEFASNMIRTALSHYVVMRIPTTGGIHNHVTQPLAQ